MKNFLIVAVLVGIAGSAFATDAEDAAERAAMQRRLNEQVMSAPFDPSDEGRAQSYSEESKKAGVVPVMRPPAYWAPGWTCANIAAYQYYQYNDYRNCVYYQYYYHRYW